MEIIILLLVILLAGGTIGWYSGTYFTRKENLVLRNQVALLESYSKHWAGEATSKYSLAQSTAQHESERLNKTMLTVIQLLQHSIIQSNGTLSQQSQQEIGKLFEQARHILPATDIYDRMSSRE